jgi:hypothetical protein
MPLVVKAPPQRRHGGARRGKGQTADANSSWAHDSSAHAVLCLGCPQPKRWSTDLAPLAVPIKFLHFILYRWTESVTCTASSVFAMGYAFSGVLAPLRVADSQVLKPWRKT